MVKAILFWCLLALSLAGYKLHYEYQLDKSWSTYADRWVQDHEGVER